MKKIIQITLILVITNIVILSSTVFGQAVSTNNGSVPSQTGKHQQAILNDDSKPQKIVISAEVIEVKRNNNDGTGREIQTNEKVIALPSVSALNGYEVQINMVNKVPNRIIKTNTEAQLSTVLDYKDVGMTISILPKITGDENGINPYITMKIKSSMSIPKSFSNNTLSLLTSETQAEMICKDGESIIVGSELKEFNNNKANNDKDKTDILIRLTPTIIKD